MRLNRTQSSSQREAGFTLIELMVAVIMVGILTSIALPQYQNYVRRGQLSDAFTTLSDMRVKMEQHYQDNKFYGSLATTTTCPTLPTYTAFPIAGKYFTLSCAAGGVTPSQTYILKATGSGGLTTGYDYTVDQNGLKGTSNFAGVASTTTICWLTRAGSCDN